MVWRELNSIKFSKNVVFFLLTSNKFAIQNNPFIQLRLIFHKKLNKLKVWQFQTHKLSSFQQLRKLLLEWKFCFVFIINFVCTHKSPIEVELSCKSFYYNFLFILLLLYSFFSSAISLFFSLIFLNKFNGYV